MNLGQLLEGQEAVTAFNKGIQLMIAFRENEALQVCLSYLEIVVHILFIV